MRLIYENQGVIFGPLHKDLCVLYPELSKVQAILGPKFVISNQIRDHWIQNEALF
jgi:hypothetical protein